MKFFISISFLIVIQLSLLGQFRYDTVSLKNTVKTNLDYNELDLFNKENNEMMNFAISKIINDSIYIPIHFHYKFFSKTTVKILMREYGFVYHNIVDGDVITSPISYFEEVMIEAAKQKYGMNFLDSIKRTSDSLDKIGLGYLEPSFVSDSISLYDYFLFKGIDKDIFTGKDNVYRLISFMVSEDGGLSDIEYYQGRGGVIITLEEMDTLSKEIFSQAMNEMPNWKPAFLKGKPLKERSYIQINGLMFDTKQK